MKRTTLTIVIIVTAAVLTIAYIILVPRQSDTDGEALQTTAQVSAVPNVPMREITGEKYVIPAAFTELPFQLQLLSEKAGFAFPNFISTADEQLTDSSDDNNDELSDVQATDEIQKEIQKANETMFTKAINIYNALYFSPSDFFDDEKTYTKNGDWIVSDYTYRGFEHALTQVFTREWVENALADDNVALKEIDGKLAYRDKKVKRAAVSNIEFTMVDTTAGEYKFSGVFKFESVSSELTADFATENGGHYAVFRWF